MYSTAINYQVSKRPMTEAESKSVDKVYKNAQKQARPAGFFALVFGAIGFFSGAATIDPSTASGMTAVLILLVGLLACVLAISTMRVRKTVKAAHDDGYVVVVQGPVSRYNGKMNTSAMTVGPLSIGWNKRNVNPLQEGSFAELACIPKLRSVVSINGAGLDQPIRVMIPTDLEARAAVAPPVNPVSAYPMTGNNVPQTNGANFCHRCGNPGAGMAFCSNCGNKL
jgi:hypothetical protein